MKKVVEILVFCVLLQGVNNLDAGRATPPPQRVLASDDGEMVRTQPVSRVVSPDEDRPDSQGRDFMTPIDRPGTSQGDSRPATVVVRPGTVTQGIFSPVDDQEGGSFCAPLVYEGSDNESGDDPVVGISQEAFNLAVGPRQELVSFLKTTLSRKEPAQREEVLTLTQEEREGLELLEFGCSPDEVDAYRTVMKHPRNQGRFTDAQNFVLAQVAIGQGDSKDLAERVACLKGSSNFVVRTFMQVVEAYPSTQRACTRWNELVRHRERSHVEREQENELVRALSDTGVFDDSGNTDVQTFKGATPASQPITPKSRHGGFKFPE